MANPASPFRIDSTGAGSDNRLLGRVHGWSRSPPRRISDAAPEGALRLVEHSAALDTGRSVCHPLSERFPFAAAGNGTLVHPGSHRSGTAGRRSGGASGHQAVRAPGILAFVGASDGPSA